jgi:hypothetical protein
LLFRIEMLIYGRGLNGFGIRRAMGQIALKLLTSYDFTKPKGETKKK